MPSYRDLDAFTACHQLMLAVHRVTETLADRDAELAGQLWAAAVIAPGRIARGSGCRQPRMFAACVDRTLGALAEVTCYLEMARTMELLSEEDHRELESLGGRAVFYSMKLAMSLEPDPAPGERPPS